MPQGLIIAAQVLGIPFLAGINLYLTVFVLGLIARFAGVLSSQFDPFAAWPVIPFCSRSSSAILVTPTTAALGGARPPPTTRRR